MSRNLAPVAPLAPIPELPPLALPGSLRADVSELVKARLTAFVVLTMMAGYALTSRGSFDWGKLLATAIGFTLVAVCSSILNQAMERDTDALMHRTELRPFVTRRLPLRGTVLCGLLLGALGLAELAFVVNGLTALLTALTLLIYVAIYTPLKRISPLNTFVGAIPGALPPLIGATAAVGHLSSEGLTLFALLAVWQLPHFYPIAWMYRDDYRAAGLRMVSVPDRTGKRTAWHALASALVLFPVSLLPTVLGLAGIFYGVCAALLSALFVAAAVRFVQQPDRSRARFLFLTSIIYLPLILSVLGLDVPVRAMLGR